MIRLRKISFSHAARVAVVSLLSIVLVACGGGGGSAGGTVGVGAGTSGGGSSVKNGNGAIQITLKDTNTGVESNSLGNGPLTAYATVKNDLGVAVANQLVTFTLSSNIALLAPASGTALTDVNGVASVGIQSAGIGSGALEVEASVKLATTAVTAKVAFAVSAAASAAPAAINFLKAVPSDSSIVIKGAGGSGRTEVAIVTFSVVDNKNVGLANKVVNFSTTSSQPVTLVDSSATTGSDGTVSVALNSGIDPTTVRVIATVAGTTISTLSDTVTVTTGQPVQTAFSLSVEKRYVEGGDFDNQPNKIFIRMADKFGGAVADGTQVVFTSTGGAIVGTGGARCLTLQGTCFVTWFSQLPRPASGVSTVTATSSSSTDLLSGSTSFVVSKSYARVYESATPTKRTPPVASGPTIVRDFSVSCAPQTVKIEIVDSNNNPLPEGTTVGSGTGTNATLSVSPSTVEYNGAEVVGSSGGSIHSVVVTPVGCDVLGSKTISGQINLSIKTPLGVTVPHSISLGSFKSL